MIFEENVNYPNLLKKKQKTLALPVVESGDPICQP